MSFTISSELQSAYQNLCGEQRWIDSKARFAIDLNGHAIGKNEAANKMFPEITPGINLAESLGISGTKNPITLGLTNKAYTSATMPIAVYGSKTINPAEIAFFNIWGQGLVGAEIVIDLV